MAPQRGVVAGRQKVDDVGGKKRMSDTALLSPSTNVEIRLRARKRLGQSVTANGS